MVIHAIDATENVRGALHRGGRPGPKAPPPPRVLRDPLDQLARLRALTDRSDSRERRLCATHVSHAAATAR
jgi:hypothetical protein